MVQGGPGFKTVRPLPQRWRVDPGGGMSFGEELRRERELRQISLDDVAQATKINLRYLDAMEHNDFLHLPGGVFNRGFVRAYCQFIGVDSEAMVNAYLVEERSQAARGRAASRTRLAPEPLPGAPAATTARARRVALGVGIALAVTLAAAVTVWLLLKGPAAIVGG